MKLEMNMIVKDAKAAGDFYKKLFSAEIISKTDLEQGMNETMMIIAGTEFRVLDENPEYGMIAPAEGVPVSLSVNLYVDDIYKLGKEAEELGCTFVSPVTEFEHAINAVFIDVFGHIWVVNQDMDKLKK